MHVYTMSQCVCPCVRVYVTVAENIKWYITHDSCSTSLSLSLFLCLSLSLRDTPHTQSQEIIRASLCGYFLSEKLGRPRWDYYNSSSFAEDLQI